MPAPRPAAHAAPVDPTTGPATGGTAIPAPAATGVLSDVPVQTEGAITPAGTVTSHPGAPAGEVRSLHTAAAPSLSTTVLPPATGVAATAPVVAVPEREFLVRNLLRQPLHHRSGTVSPFGAKHADGRPADLFNATEREILAYGAQVQRI